jgi:hypothetical protein
MTEHKQDCPWHSDWHACNCGAFDIPKPPQEHLCLEVIPGSFIMCGENDWYCSPECMRKANEKNSMR